jgi:hypothetical protein
MSSDKFDAITGSGIDVIERIPIPDNLVPADAQVEIQAKRAAGYYSDPSRLKIEPPDKVRGRDLGVLGE